MIVETIKLQNILVLTNNFSFVIGQSNSLEVILGSPTNPLNKDKPPIAFCG